MLTKALTKLKTSTCAFATILAVGLSGAVTPAFAELQVSQTPRIADLGLRIESDSADRMLIASELRALSQQVAAASCALAAHIETDRTHDALEQAITDFDMYLTALRDGDAQLNVTRPEARPATLARIDAVSEEWAVMQAAASGVLRADSSADHRAAIENHAEKLLELTNLLSADIISQYAYPFEVTTADALMIEFAGRQQMLSQKMAHSACQVWSGNGTVEARAELRETMEIFEASLNGLRYGMPDLGLRGAPNDAIRADLDALLATWDGIKSSSERLLDDENLSQAQSAEVYQGIEVELASFNGLLTNYKDHAERSH